MNKKQERTVSASNFIATIAVNVNNRKMPDKDFRELIRNTLPIVIYDKGINEITIEATEIDFTPISIHAEELKSKAADIWNNPKKYYGFEDAYYDFLKYLWIVYSDGTERQLADYVNEECKDLIES